MSIKQVTAGIIINNGKILIAQRKRGKNQEFMWEFPGGKLEDGETLQKCLKRELIEELNLSVVIGDFFMQSSFDYDFGTIELNAFWATCEQDNLTYHPDHEQARWISIDEIDNYTFSPADIPIVEALKSLDKV